MQRVAPEPCRFLDFYDFMNSTDTARGEMGGEGMSLIGSQGTCTPPGTLEQMNRVDWATAAELYERHLEDVFRYVLHRVPRQDEAEDLTADVFAAAFTGLSRFRGQCPSRLWLLSIARRKIIDARRRSARQETLASELADEGPEAAALWEALAVDDGPEAALMRAEARRVLGELVAQLNPDQREALMLQYVEQLSVAEIAQVMGRSPGSVKGLLERAKATLYRRGRGYFLEDEERER